MAAPALIELEIYSEERSVAPESVQSAKKALRNIRLHTPDLQIASTPIYLRPITSPDGAPMVVFIGPVGELSRIEIRSFEYDTEKHVGLLVVGNNTGEQTIRMQNHHAEYSVARSLTRSGGLRTPLVGTLQSDGSFTAIQDTDSAGIILISTQGFLRYPDGDLRSPIEVINLPA